MEYNLISGIELTSFYGHLLILGINEYIDWRDLTKFNIEKKLLEIKSKNAISGIAHPFRIGDPVATGCHWEFELNDYSKLNYLEVWSSVNPHLNPQNEKAWKLWTKLLNKGYKVSVVSGRDWHRVGKSDEIPAVTYIEICDSKDLTFEEKIIKAIKAGRTCVSLGPVLDLKYKTNICNYPNNSLNKYKTIHLKIEIDWLKKTLPAVFQSNNLNLVLESNLEIIFDEKIEMTYYKKDIKIEFKGEKWLRLILYCSSQKVAFTSAIYID